ncbi:SDR family NAD(P)-dependent oxidoreductase [Streptosporangium fragile]|uniref:SDR family NAD(P)-dependent oxidoreductase n=1 Tax=Streptosporangium fragile TaxID=46186 RepID=A0ABN3VWI9_9ACTN
MVTGAASGIGELAVRRMRSRGIKVVAGDVSSDITRRYAGDDGVIGLRADVTDPDSVDALVKQAEHMWGPVDRLFHSAGIMPAGAVADVDTDHILKVMEVNYAGTVHAIKAVLPSMVERDFGQIIALGSLTGYVPSLKFSAYSASKAAVNTFVETLAHEHRGSGVQVLLVAPTAVLTPLLKQAEGGSKHLARAAARGKSRLAITPDRVLDDIDRALKRGDHVVIPGGRAVYGARRLAPGVLWRALERFG